MSCADAVREVPRAPTHWRTRNRRQEIFLPQHKPVLDPILGQATWDENQNSWCFTLVLPSGRMVARSLTPEDNGISLASPVFGESRECVRWVRDNELKLRQYVADQMYSLMLDWHDDSTGPTLSKEEFRENIAMRGVLVLEDHRASLLFDDAGLFGGHTITFSVGADGRLDEEPYLWG